MPSIYCVQVTVLWKVIRKTEVSKCNESITQDCSLASVHIIRNFSILGIIVKVLHFNRVYGPVSRPFVNEYIQ